MFAPSTFSHLDSHEARAPRVDRHRAVILGNDRRSASRLTSTVRGISPLRVVRLRQRFV
jgi:hypothetical protein